VVYLLPVFFYFDGEHGGEQPDNNWKKNDRLNMASLRAPPPDKDTVQSTSDETEKTFQHRGI
jgi:hypothetical protein